MSKIALVVGVNFYTKYNQLSGCINDANDIANLLSTHENGDKNFEVKKICVSDKFSAIDSNTLLKEVKSIFDNNHNDTALFYFSGHGGITKDKGGFIAASTTENISTGVSLAELIEIINDSHVKNKIIIIDACHSGEMGNHPLLDCNASLIGEGVTILTASSKEQYAMEDDLGPYNRHGVFTKLLLSALEGGASNILGQITPGSIYAHIDKAIGNFGQRPIFKTNTNRFIEIRNVRPRININEIRELPKIFSDEDTIFTLDQSYESDSNVPKAYSNKKPCNEQNHKKFKILQNLNRVDLVIPIDAEHMYYAAMDEKACKLTPIGKFYFELAKNKKL